MANVELVTASGILKTDHQGLVVGLTVDGVKVLLKPMEDGCVGLQVMKLKNPNILGDITTWIEVENIVIHPR